jgi:hypothetical protein
MRAKCLANAQQGHCARENGIRTKIPEDDAKEDGMSTFLPPPVTGQQ